MPIVTIHFGHVPLRLHDAVPAALAEALGCPAEDVWVYGVEAEERKGCAFVTVRARARDEARVAAGLAAVAGAVAAALELPLEDVWVHWMDLPDGRVFAGGEVR